MYVVSFGLASFGLQYIYIYLGNSFECLLSGCYPELILSIILPCSPFMDHGFYTRDSAEAKEKRYISVLTLEHSSLKMVVIG